MNTSLILSILATIGALVAGGYTATGFFQSKKNAFISIAHDLIDGKNAFLEGYQNLQNAEDEDYAYLKEEYAANYCNILEYACELYLKNGIDKKLFKNTFKYEVIAIANKNGPASFLNDDFTTNDDIYASIKKVKDEFLNEETV